MRHDFLFAATRASVDGYQPALFNVELFGVIHCPFMVPVATQRIPFVLILQRGLTKWNNLRHTRVPLLSQQRALHGRVPG